MSNRAQYQRNWVAAARSLRNSQAGEAVDYSSDSSAGCVYHALSENDDLGNDMEQIDDEFIGEQFVPIQENVFLEDDISGTISDNELEWNMAENNFSDFSDDPGSDDDLIDGLTSWANKFQIKQNALDSLLKLLKQSGHPSLPGCARTLLNTAREVPLQIKSGMQYIYFPLADKLLKHLNRYPNEEVNVVETIQIALNIDGLPLFKSSQNALWPVLCAIVNLKPATVFPVALTYGVSKPKDLEFLQDLVRDLANLLENGLQCDNRRVGVSLNYIVCDAPAKAFVKATKLYSGYFGCDKCTQRGGWNGRLIYPEVETIELRTDLSFRQQTNKEHHHGTSPFCNLPIDMVKHFPIDYMHQVCLGVMKKLLLLWIRGKREVKMSGGHMNEISGKLVGLKQFIPSCFARKPRGFNEVDRWKATEFRQFLLYTGKIVLHGILRDELYDHFLVLSVAICILVCPSLARVHRNYAHQLLTYFVQQGSILYGDEFLVYNVHSMVHLADDVDKYGSLDACSAFAFENYMQCIKRLVRSGNNPIVQIAKRLGESSGETFPQNKHTRKDVKIKKPNNSFILNNSSCCEVVDTSNERDAEGNHMYICRVYAQIEALFQKPCDSRLIGVFKANLRQTSMKLLSSRCFERKAIMVDLGPTKTIFMELLHSV